MFTNEELFLTKNKGVINNFCTNNRVTWLLQPSIHETRDIFTRSIRECIPEVTSNSVVVLVFFEVSFKSFGKGFVT